MSNSSYLCCSPLRGASPSRRRGYRVEQHTVACDVGGVPLLWLALFRSGHLDARASAPVARLDEALEGLEAGARALEKLFERPAALSVHAASLATALRDVGAPHVTIELEEIAALYGKRELRGMLRAALGFFDDPDGTLTAWNRERAVRRARDAATPVSDRLKRIRERHPGIGLGDARALLERHGGDPAAVIAALDSARDPIERARDQLGDMMASVRGERRDSAPPSIDEVFVRLSQLERGVAWVAPHAPASDAEIVQRVRLLGARHERPVPWER